MTNDIKIDWKRYVDKIYLIRYICESDYRIKKCNEELKRVDILDSDIFYEFVNINSPFYKDIYNNFFTKFSKEIPYSYAIDCTFAHYYCMKHAEHYGYERILILESDNVFLKDKNQIIELLEKSKELMDENKNSLSILNAIYADCPVYSFYLDNKFHLDFSNNRDLYGAGFNIYSKEAYKLFIKKYENYEINIIDTYKSIYKDNIIIFSNEVNISIQQDWLKFVINADILYNVNINKDYIERFKNDKLELFDSWICNFNNLQKINDYNLINLKNENNVFYNYYMRLFLLLNRSFFDNKLNINDYIIKNDYT